MCEGGGNVYTMTTEGLRKPQALNPRVNPSCGVEDRPATVLRGRAGQEFRGERFGGLGGLGVQGLGCKDRVLRRV